MSRVFSTKRKYIVEFYEPWGNSFIEKGWNSIFASDNLNEAKKSAANFRQYGNKVRIRAIIERTEVIHIRKRKRSITLNK